MAERRKKWIAGAIEKPGSFAAKAKRAGMSTAAYAKAKEDAPGRLGKQARLAQTLGKLRKKG
jgi:hypothetical protein